MPLPHTHTSELQSLGSKGPRMEEKEAESGTWRSS